MYCKPLSNPDLTTKFWFTRGSGRLEAGTNGKDEIFNIQFRRETDGSAELSVNLVGPTGEVATSITLFDLDV
jgi:hypothetical protein